MNKNSILIFSIIISLLLIIEGVWAIYKQYQIVGYILFILGLVMLGSIIFIIGYFTERNIVRLTTEQKKLILSILYLISAFEIIYVFVAFGIKFGYITFFLVDNTDKYYPNMQILTDIKLTENFTLADFCKLLAQTPHGTVDALVGHLSSTLLPINIRNNMRTRINYTIDHLTKEHSKLFKRDANYEIIENNILNYVIYRFDNEVWDVYKYLDDEIFYEHFIWWFGELYMLCAPITNTAFIKNNKIKITFFDIIKTFKAQTQTKQTEIMEYSLGNDPNIISDINNMDEPTIETILRKIIIRIFEIKKISIIIHSYTNDTDDLSPTFMTVITQWFVTQINLNLFAIDDKITLDNDTIPYMFEYLVSNVMNFFEQFPAYYA